MTRTINRVELLGRVGIDPEMTYTPNDTAVTRLRLATDRYRRNAENGNDWHTVVVWGKTARGREPVREQGPADLRGRKAGAELLGRGGRQAPPLHGGPRPGSGLPRPQRLQQWQGARPPVRRPTPPPSELHISTSDAPQGGAPPIRGRLSVDWRAAPLLFQHHTQGAEHDRHAITAQHADTLLDALRSNLDLLGELAVRYQVPTRRETPTDPPTIGSPQDVHLLLAREMAPTRPGAAQGAPSQRQAPGRWPAGDLPGNREFLPGEDRGGAEARRGGGGARHRRGAQPPVECAKKRVV